jgi:hypothetical protein
MIRKLFSVLTAVILLSGCNLLEDYNKGRQVKNLVHDAVEVLEAEGSAGFDQFTSEPWVDGEYYLFAFRIDGVQVFHAITPELDGQNRIDNTDINGVRNIENMVAIAQNKGRGWTKYHRENPATGEVEAKKTYILTTTLDGETIFIGSGYYRKAKPDVDSDY